MKIHGQKIAKSGSAELPVNLNAFPWQFFFNLKVNETWIEILRIWYAVNSTVTATFKAVQMKYKQ